MTKKLQVEICMNDSAARAAKTFWVDNHNYRIETSTGGGDEYTAYERKGATGTDQIKLGEGDADAPKSITVIVFAKDD